MRPEVLQSAVSQLACSEGRWTWHDPGLAEQSFCIKQTLAQAWRTATPPCMTSVRAERSERLLPTQNESNGLSTLLELSRSAAWGPARIEMCAALQWLAAA